MNEQRLCLLDSKEDDKVAVPVCTGTWTLLSHPTPPHSNTPITNHERAVPVLLDSKSWAPPHPPKALCVQVRHFCVRKWVRILCAQLSQFCVRKWVADHLCSLNDQNQSLGEAKRPLNEGFATRGCLQIAFARRFGQKPSSWHACGGNE